jgi:hypothetical protein
MMRCQKLSHRFVQFVPEKLEPGVLYVSLEYATSSHACCCGCGEEVVIPFSPVGWRMTFDGESVSIWPSVGSWTLRCRSHYVIDRGNVVKAPPWSESQVAAERLRDKAARERHYGAATVSGASESQPAPLPSPELPGWWTRFRRWVFGAK